MNPTTTHGGWDGGWEGGMEGGRVGWWVGGWGRSGNSGRQLKQLNSETPCDLKTPHTLKPILPAMCEKIRFSTSFVPQPAENNTFCGYCLQMTDKRQKDHKDQNIKAMNLIKKTAIRGIRLSLKEAFEFCCGLKKKSKFYENRPGVTYP